MQDIVPSKSFGKQNLLSKHEDQRAVNGGKANHFEAERRGKIDQSYCTNIGHSQYNNLEYTEKERNYCCTEQQTSNRSAKDNDSS